jgi:hypothetical protein
MGLALVSAGKNDKGLALLADAAKMGDAAKHPEEVKLHQGIALLQAGKKAQANTVLKSVKGTDGAADLARYWTYVH